MPKEYIEREALINRLEVSPLLKPNFSFWENTRIGIIDLVKRQPTADVVEVVRCKDCERGGKIYGKAILCSEHKRITRPDDFCSYGERKDSNK